MLGLGFMRTVMLALCTLVLFPALAQADPGHWTVKKGDTLTSIAKRHNVTVADLRTWNELDGDVIKLGAKLHVRPQTRTYKIRRGDTLNTIAKREGTTLGVIVQLNPKIKPNRIKAGEKIRLPAKKRVKKKKPKIAKAPKLLPLKCPGRMVQVPRHNAYKLRSKGLGWVTAKTARALKRGFDNLRAKHRHAPRVRVLDASQRGGGQLGGHLSHRDGRDVDITYFQRKCGPRGCPLEAVSPKRLDVKRQWSLIRYWLENDDVQYIFIDYHLQKVLYEHAVKNGVSKTKLKRWFQYPRPVHKRKGRIRHWESHRNHLHARFWQGTCTDGCCSKL